MFKKKHRLIIMTAVLTLICSACGKNEAEKITGYGETTASSATAASEEFNKNKVNGQKIKIDTASLMYYPVHSEENPTESTLVPAWSFNVVSNGVIGEIIMNALDGSLLSIIYLI